MLVVSKEVEFLNASFSTDTKWSKDIFKVPRMHNQAKELYLVSKSC